MLTYLLLHLPTHTSHTPSTQIVFRIIQHDAFTTHTNTHVYTHITPTPNPHLQPHSRTHDTVSKPSNIIISCAHAYIYTYTYILRTHICTLPHPTHTPPTQYTFKIIHHDHVTHTCTHAHKRAHTNTHVYTHTHAHPTHTIPFQDHPT